MTTQTTLPSQLAEQFPDVSETGLLTLYCRAIESRSAQPILKDILAEEIARRLDPILLASPSPLAKRLARGKIQTPLVVHIALRAQKYDDYCRQFLAAHSDGIIVNLGCGMATRFWRIDNGSVQFFDLDLPDMIELKRKIFPTHDRYTLIPASVFDYDWMDLIASAGKAPVLFLAEGLFMYLPQDHVVQLFRDISTRFPGSELVCEVVNKRVLRGVMNKMLRIKLQQQMHIGKDVSFSFGISDSREPETWQAGIIFLDDWSYFDTRHPKLGAMGLMGRSRYFRSFQYTAHYRLG
jgi:methyltransferase (TIGR00027 family)